MVNIKSGRVGVTTSEADRTYAAEYAFEDEMPGRTLSLDEANSWLAMIAETEGVDRPVAFKLAMSKDLAGLAFNDQWCIAVEHHAGAAARVIVFRRWARALPCCPVPMSEHDRIRDWCRPSRQIAAS